MSDLFDRELEQILRQASRRMPVPRCLYHYTSPAGFLGIEASRVLRASNIWYLNDQTEFALALEVAGECANSLAESLQAEFDLRVLEVIREAVRASTDTAVFVASFSANGDQLSQWRGYCPAGSGYSLGFDRHALLRFLRSDGRFFLAPVVYDAVRQRAIIQRLLTSALTYADSIWQRDPDNSARVLREIYQEISALLAITCPLMKDESFAEEAEWRAVSLPKAIDRSDWQFRVGRSMVVPFVAVRLADANGTLHLEEVVVGPTPHSALAVAAVEAMSRTGGVQIDRVSGSSIPFRDW